MQIFRSKPEIPQDLVEGADADLSTPGRHHRRAAVQFDPDMAAPRLRWGKLLRRFAITAAPRRRSLRRSSLLVTP